MNVRYNQFIGMYSDVLPEMFCQHLINEFENVNKNGIIKNRKQSENALNITKNDSFLFLNLKNIEFNKFNDKNCTDILWNSLQTCFDDYVSEYDILTNINLRCHSLKMQKTNPGGGYHIWHCEQEGGNSANRSLVFSFYLNDIDSGDGGETEFLYQKLRIPAKENTCVIWPAGFTHPHRGNTVLGSVSKYIVTGWFYNEL